MFNWVSKKELEEIKLFKHDIGGLWSLTKRFENRITALENAAKCAKGEHEWETVYEKKEVLTKDYTYFVLQGLENDKSKPYAKCKHCGALPEKPKVKKGKK